MKFPAVLLSPGLKLAVPASCANGTTSGTSIINWADGTVTVKITQHDGVQVRVIDQGPGIDETALARIFEPLEQAEHLSTRTHQGIGIGLSLARMSAHAMGGDVTLERTGPDGSTFLWSLAVG